MVHNEAEEQLSSSKEAEEGDSTRQTNEVPDGGFTAWVQVASTFCIYLNTWFVRPAPILSYRGCQTNDISI